MEHLRCVIERITYQNPQNGYTVLKAAVKGSPDLVTIAGPCPRLTVGSVLSLEGFWKMDAKYGGSSPSKSSRRPFRPLSTVSRNTWAPAW